jgi:hypothetical protein
VQHELFVRAALHGQREAIYQACLFDPLTAAMLPADRIVQMCDEMIAAHGSSLPTLDGSRTLVPTSGTEFGSVARGHLRDARRQRQIRSLQEYLVNWHVIGPFPSPEHGRVSLDMPTPLEESLPHHGSAAIDLRAPCRVGDGVLHWRQAHAAATGLVNLDECLGRHEWAVAYAYTTFESDRDHPTILRCGSDDGIRIWLNGQLVHNHEIGRAFAVDADWVPVNLRSGANHILVKIDNYQGGWGFGLALARDAESAAKAE